jgi:hypothetical protein
MSEETVTHQEKMTRAVGDGAEVRTDANREIRSMLLSVHPCPPLPQIANHSSDSCQRVFSSHDFLATAIDRMLIQPDFARDSDRHDQQLLLCQNLASTLKDVLEKAEQSNKAETVYDLFTCFSRNYTRLYFDKKVANDLDIRFMPWDYVCKGNSVHMLACSHLRAYRIMKGIEPTSFSQFEDLSYSNVLLEFAKETVQGEDFFE